MNKIIKLLFVGCLVSLLGCSNTSAVIAKEIKNDEVKITYSQVAGKYIHFMTQDIYIELNEDGTFINKFGKRSNYGNYVINGDRIIFNQGKYEYKLDGNTLISDDGMARYVKK